MSKRRRYSAEFMCGAVEQAARSGDDCSPPIRWAPRRSRSSISCRWRPSEAHAVSLRWGQANGCDRRSAAADLRRITKPCQGAASADELEQMHRPVWSLKWQALASTSTNAACMSLAPRWRRSLRKPWMSLLRSCTPRMRCWPSCSYAGMISARCRNVIW